MKKTITTGILAAALLVGLIAAHADESPATQPHDAAYWNDLTARLNNEDPKVRKAAQNELEQIPLNEKAVLEKLAKSAGDDEVKNRLAARLEEMDQQLAISPPPISIDIKDARLREVADALGKAAGVSIDCWNGDSSSRFTLAANDKPFWEIFAALSRQHSLGVQPYNGFHIQEQEAGLTYSVPASGAFVLFPGEIRISRTANLQNPAGGELGPEQLTFSFTLAGDPRVKVLAMSQPTLTEAIDDAGNNLAPPADNNPQILNDNSQRTCLFPQTISLTMPDPTHRLGNKIVLARGEMLISVQVAEERVEVARPREQLNQPIKVGDRSVTISKFEYNVKNSSIEFQINADNPVIGPQRAHGQMVRQQPIMMEFIDSKDHLIWSNALYGGSGGSCGATDLTPPIKIRFSCPTKTKDVPISFEVKDLPLP